MMRQRRTSCARTPEQLAEVMARPLVVVTKVGRLANGGELGHGTIWHLAEFGSDWAICGAMPSHMLTTWGEPTVTCPRCARLRDKYQPKIITDKEAMALLEAERVRRLAELPPAAPKPARPLDPNSFLGRLIAQQSEDGR